MKVLITGGGGFLGSAIIDGCLARGYEVHSLARGDYPRLRAKGVRTFRGDIAEADVVQQATDGVDAVFHVAARVGIWGGYDDYYRANVIGTQNVISACRLHRVERLVYTSSPSVIQRSESVEGADESLPYPHDHMTHYQSTKAEAERLVMGANSATLRTVSLRPRMIWGPGDTQLGPRLIQRSRAGRLRLVGDGSSLVDSVYIDNAVHCHMLAFDDLGASALSAGKCYFLTNDEPWPIARLMNSILAAGGEPPVERSVSPRTAYVVGALLELVWRLFKMQSEPPMTRFLARQLCTANWYNIEASKRDLGYSPQVTMTEGLLRLQQWFEEHPP